MKHVKKIFAFALALVMTFAVSAIAFAEPDALPAENTGTITVNNAARGETYKAFKILDAQVGANGAIVYKGTIPADLASYFTTNDAGEISVATGVTNEDLFGALKTYVEGLADGTEKAKTTADSETVVFENLQFGYYVITSSQGNGAAISVTSTDPNGVVNEKNESTVSVTKAADGETYSIGDTVTYTVTFNGVNYRGKDDAARIVTSYTVTDTLPAYLSNATVTGISIGGTAKTVNEDNFPGVTTFGTNKTFNIPWAQWNATNKKWGSLYNNGTTIEITYAAILTDVVRVGEDNKNTVTISPNVGKNDGDEEPYNEKWEAFDTIKTYATAIKKVDGDGKPLAGAKFKIQGLTATKGEDGVYTVTAYKPAGDGAISLDDSTEMEVDANGMLYIVGLKDALTLSLTETVAPTGYNRLERATSITSQLQSTETFKLTGYRTYDSDGNIIAESEETISEGTAVTANLSDLDATALQIQNNKGTTMPSTGGIGTTIFYVVGGVMVAGAAIFLLTKRRAAASE